MPDEELPYLVEIWEAVDGAEVNKVLARASNVTLARAIYLAAKEEYPDRRVTVRHGNETITDLPD